MSCWQQDSLLLICPGIYTQIYHRNLCPAVLIWKRVKKKQRRGRIISNFTNAKGETFPSLTVLWQPSWLLLGVISQFGLQDKGLPLPFSLAKKKMYLDTQLKLELTKLFWKVPGYFLFPHRQKVDRNVKTLIMVNINPICKR